MFLVFCCLIFHMGENLLFQTPVVSIFGLFYSIFRLICQKFGLFVETTGFETTGFSPYKLSLSLFTFLFIYLLSRSFARSRRDGVSYGCFTILAIYHLGKQKVRQSGKCLDCKRLTKKASNI